jgi:hypothetical protein
MVAVWLGAAGPVADCVIPPGAPPGLCAAFVARLAAVHPGAVAGPQAGVRLVVTQAGPRRLAARIEWRQGEGWRAGPTLAAARADGALDAAGLTRFLDALIAASPRP